jgi:hypothetical protein
MLLQVLGPPGWVLVQRGHTVASATGYLNLFMTNRLNLQGTYNFFCAHKYKCNTVNHSGTTKKAKDGLIIIVKGEYTLCTFWP